MIDCKVVVGAVREGMNIATSSLFSSDLVRYNEMW